MGDRTLFYEWLLFSVNVLLVGVTGLLAYSTHLQAKANPPEMGREAR